MTDFEKYFKSLQSHKIDHITEHSHRPALKELFENIADANIKILHEPKREGSSDRLILRLPGPKA